MTRDSHLSEYGAGAPIPRATADSSDLDPGAGYELWHETCRPVLETAVRAPLKSFQAAFDFFNVDGLVFNRVRYSATRFSRSARHLRNGESDMIVLHMMLKGRECGEVEGGHTLDMGPGRIVLHDWSQPYSSVAEDTEQISVAIPRDRITARDWLHQHRPVVSWECRSPQGMVLANALSSIWQCLPHSTEDDAPALASGFLGLLNGLLDPRASRHVSPHGTATLAAMQAYLNTHMNNPAVGIDDLMQTFRCSRSTIYRLFREAGGVRYHLQELRLAAAFRRLSEFGATGCSISQLSADCGFTDPGHFHRAFKRKFGITPGDIRGRPEGRIKTEQTPPGLEEQIKAIAAVHGWMRKRT